jgi:ribose transport system substrate-binding protein
MTNKLSSSIPFRFWLVIGLWLTACTSPSATPPTVQPPSATLTSPLVEPTPSIDLTALRATRPWRIAFVPKFKFLAETGQLSSYWQPAWEGAQQAGRDLNVTVELVTAKVRGSSDAEYVEPQIRLVADLIKRGDIDGLVIAPFDSNRLAPVVEKAVAAGIPTIAMDTPVNSDRLLTFVVFDNFKAGQAMGEWVVQRLGRPGRVLILDGPSDQQNAVDRRNGFFAGLQTGTIDVLDARSADWEIEPARKITTGWLAEYANIDAILAANDNMALGAAQAVAEAGRRGIIITGFDATDAGLAAIQAGQVSATIDQAPGKQARLAVQLLVRHLEKGEKFPPTIFLSDIPLVTQENVGDYLSQKGLK